MERSTGVYRPMYTYVWGTSRLYGNVRCNVLSREHEWTKEWKGWNKCTDPQCRECVESRVIYGVSLGRAHRRWSVGSKQVEGRSR